MADDGGGVSPGAVRSIARSVIYSLFGGADTISTLRDFASGPIDFIRRRVVPMILGAIFGFVFNLAEIIAAPFASIQNGLETLASALASGMGSIYGPIAGAISSTEGWILSVTAPLGPFQPYVVTVIVLILLYVLLIVLIRLTRAILDSIPIVSGVETFLFG